MGLRSVNRINPVEEALWGDGRVDGEGPLGPPAMAALARW